MLTPPDPEAYSRIVWDIVRQIPSGVVSTYGQIASMIPPPQGVDPDDYARLAPVWVGKALNAVSAADAPDIPWQRVVNGQGGISLPEGSRAAAEQRARLEREGATFDKNGRVSLQRLGWDGPDANWLKARGLLPPRPLKTRPDGGQLPLF
jgi:methylated-DNA-protein-cysteine methyltransferase-like protein